MLLTSYSLSRNNWDVASSVLWISNARYVTKAYPTLLMMLAETTGCARLRIVTTIRIGPADGQWISYFCRIPTAATATVRP